MSEVTSASSISSTSGRRMSARASPMRRCSPADSAVVQSASSSSRSIRCMRPAARHRASDFRRRKPRPSSAGAASACRSVPSGKYGRADSVSTRAPAGIRIWPSPNGQMPVSARNSVVLPEPDAPLIRSRSPARERQLRNAGDAIAALAAQHELFQREILARLVHAASIAPCAGAVVSTRLQRQSRAARGGPARLSIRRCGCSS